MDFNYRLPRLRGAFENRCVEETCGSLMSSRSKSAPKKKAVTASSKAKVTVNSKEKVLAASLRRIATAKVAEVKPSKINLKPLAKAMVSRRRAPGLPEVSTVTDFKQMTKGNMDPRRQRYKRGDLDMKTVDSEAQASGISYQASLADPRQYPGVRVPDLISLPTTVAPDFRRITIPPCQQATTDSWYTIVECGPTCDEWFRYVTAIDLSGQPTWSSWFQSSNQTSFAANMAGQRMVSGGIYVQDASALLERNGLIFANCYGGGCDSLDLNILYLLQDPGASMANVADATDMDEFLCSWRPSDYIADLDFNVVSANANLAAGSYCYVLVQHFPEDDNTPASLEFEIRANREFIPLPFTRQLFENDVAVGGPEDSTRAQDAIVAKANASSGSSSNWMTKIRSVVDGAVKIGGYVQKGLGFASMFAGLLAVPSRPDLEKRHLTAVGEGHIERSPYYFSGGMNKRDVFALMSAAHCNRPVPASTPSPFRDHIPIVSPPCIQLATEVKDNGDGRPPQTARSSIASDFSVARSAVLIKR